MFAHRYRTRFRTTALLNDSPATRARAESLSRGSECVEASPNANTGPLFPSSSDTGQGHVSYDFAGAVGNVPAELSHCEEQTVDSTTILLVVILVLVFVSLFTRGAGDSPRLRTVERKLDLLLKQLGVDPNEGLDEQIQQLVKSGQKIEAIKLYRMQSGLGLKEAKEHIEQQYGM